MYERKYVHVMLRCRAATKSLGSSGFSFWELTIVIMVRGFPWRSSTISIPLLLLLLLGVIAAVPVAVVITVAAAAVAVAVIVVVAAATTTAAVVVVTAVAVVAYIINKTADDAAVTVAFLI